MTYKSRVLVTDDDPMHRENLGDFLMHEGYEVEFASNGMQALAAAVAFKPDLILSDVMMPEMDGFELCRRLRAYPETAEMPIILITALNDPNSRLRGIEAGADDFISKPFDIIELKARVQSVTRLNRYRSLLTERAKFERVVNHAQMGYLLLNDENKILFAKE